ncbi:MAG: hypothetical protein HY926_14410 [Elusimicrobia bacterium]|nr:hypothetical protein [Elusimicrobiota bacterium]
MRSPAEMTVIQIDITNVCARRCAHCTRFCGHHARPAMMDFETFKKAVDSLRDFPGIVGITGGEPTLHPRFEEFVRYYRSVIGSDPDSSGSYPPQSDFMGYLIAERMDILRHNHRGLFTSLGEKYYEHLELIQDTFGVQIVNDHSHPSRHSALLLTRAELGIPDAEWLRLRDDCWVQKYWSASVTPKGAFFCEVAGALDALSGGSGGWPIEPDWWTRTPADFVEQLKWCELCGAALPTPLRDANDEVDEVSPLWRKKLDELRSPKARAGLVRELDVAGYAGERHGIGACAEPYFSGERMRMAKGQSALVPREVTTVTLASGEPAGPALREAGDRARDWVLLLHGTEASEDLEAMLRTHVFNPGCLYHLRNAPGRRPLRADFFSVRAAALRSGRSLEEAWGAYPERKQVHATVPASSGPWAVVGLASRGACHAGREASGWGRYLESLWSVTISRPGDAALLWNIILGKLGLARWLPACRIGNAWVSAWLTFVLLLQLYVYRHTANGLGLAGRAREALAAAFLLAAVSLSAECVGGLLLRRPYPERLRSGNALWFAASAAAALLYLSGYLIRCGLGDHGLRRPWALAAVLLSVGFAVLLVRGRGGGRHG